MVAGAGTYALGRAAIVYFLEGVSLKDAQAHLPQQPEENARARLVTSADVREDVERARK